MEVWSAGSKVLNWKDRLWRKRKRRNENFWKITKQLFFFFLESHTLNPLNHAFKYWSAPAFPWLWGSAQNSSNPKHWACHARILTTVISVTERSHQTSDHRPYPGSLKDLPRACAMISVSTESRGTGDTLSRARPLGPGRRRRRRRLFLRWEIRKWARQIL